MSRDDVLGDMVRMAARLDEAGHHDVADRLDTMIREAGLFGLPFRMLGGGLRGAGNLLRLMGRHPYATTALATSALGAKNYMQDPSAGVPGALLQTGRDIWSIPSRLRSAWRGFSDPSQITPSGTAEEDVVEPMEGDWDLIPTPPIGPPYPLAVATGDPGDVPEPGTEPVILRNSPRSPMHSLVPGVAPDDDDDMTIDQRLPMDPRINPYHIRAFPPI